MASSNIVTLKKIAENIHQDWDLDEWFKWPPNLFVLCSVILQRTGSYKICLIDCEWWNKEDWQDKIEEAADLWIQFTNDLILDKNIKFDYTKSKVLNESIEILKDDWNSDDPINIDYLRVLGKLFNETPSKEDKKIINFIKAIIVVAVAADVSCAGLGFLGQPSSDKRKKYRLFEAVANLLLNTTGSLSTLPKFYGIVLPKMRTPQAGLVYRSLTHHLTFHTTEVEVMWRTIPWLNNHKQNLNILVVPYPTKIHKKDFEIVEESFHSVRYFKGKTKDKDRDDKFIEALVEKVIYYSSNNNEIDILVLPEMSLTEDQYNYLLETFSIQYHKNDFSCLQLPIIIAGVIKENKEKSGIDFLDSTFHNEARIAIYFAAKWYDITQRKHHRWQLDRNQILQYKLEGYFPTDRKWFEFSSVSQRRLTILVPNGWLALTALICEDLARQEPVSEVIRGIGPSLLMALLSDGPQLNGRWSSRYASVLADDPGTAVLSLTSQGMADRSQPLEGRYINTSKNLDYKATVGFWKDMIKGWKELVLEGENDALLFTISAEYMEEFTIDGRTDYNCASVFKMDTIIPKQVKFSFNYTSKKQSGTENKINRRYEESNGNKPVSANIDRYLGKWNDIRELSGLLFSLDAIIDLLNIATTEVKATPKSENKRYQKNKPLSKKAKAEIEKSINIIIDLLDPQLEQSKRHTFLNEISDNVSNSWRQPHKVGIEAKYDPDANDDMQNCVREIKSITGNMLKKQFKNTTEFLNQLIDDCEAILKNKRSSSRIVRLAPMGILFNINTRLSNLTSPKDKTKGYNIDGMTTEITMAMQKKIKSILHIHLKIKPEQYRS